MDRGVPSQIRRTVFFRVKQCYADITFSFRQQAVPVLIENQVEGHYIRIRADDYLGVLDNLYPAGGTPYDFSMSCALFGIAFPLLHSSQNPSKWEVYLLPFLAEQNVPYVPDRRPILETTVRRQSYLISVNATSLWIFFGLTTATIVSCLILSCYNRKFQVPDTCPFPEFDLASRLRGQDKAEMMKFSKLARRIANGKVSRDLRDFTVISTIRDSKELELDTLDDRRDA